MSFTYITGSGTQADPYVISDKNGWSEFCNHVNNGNSMVGEYVELSADIRYNDSDENKDEYSRRNYSEDTPIIGDYRLGYDKSFRGDFNGNNHTIYGINIGDNYRSRCVISVSNGAHIHHVRFEKIVSTKWSSSDKKNIYGVPSSATYTPFDSCINVYCRSYINPFDNSTHIKENGSYVVLNDIVCSGSVNFVTVDGYGFVTLKNILYSCDFLTQGMQQATYIDGDELPYYLVEVTGRKYSGINETYMNINTTDTEAWYNLPFLTNLNTAIQSDYIIKNNEIYANSATRASNSSGKFKIKPTVSISNCTAYNAFLINPDLVRPDSRSENDGKPTFTEYQYLLRDSVSYFPDSEFFNHKLSTYSEIKPHYLDNFNMHRLHYSFYNHMSERTLTTDYDDEIYCFGGDNSLSDSTQPLMNSNTLFVSGDCSDAYISRLSDISFPDSLKRPAVLVSDMQNTYINSLREIMTEEYGLSYATTDTIPQFTNSTKMLFSSDLNCYVPAPFVNDYVYWNIKSTPDNYRLFWCYNQYYTYQRVLWCVGNIGLIRKGTNVNFGIGCIDEYKNQLLSATFTANGSSISYTFDENECHSETYSNVTTSMNIDLSINFEQNFSGNGTSQSPYLISNSNDLEAFLWFIHYFGFESNLKNVNKNLKNNYFKLTSDITLQDSSTINSLSLPDSGIYYSCTSDETDFIYSQPSRDGYYGCFCGTFDGNNHIISGLYDQYFAMSSGAVIKNTYFKICNISFFMFDEKWETNMYYRSENPPTIIDSYLSGYIDFKIILGHVKRCVIHNLKYFMAGYNMVAVDHYPYNIPDTFMIDDTPEYIEPDVEFSDCLFMENAPNILFTSTESRSIFDVSQLLGKSLYTPCYNLYNNVYIGTYENAIFSPYHIECDEHYDEIVILQRQRENLYKTYQNKYKTLYIKSSSLIHHEIINNCGTIINDDKWNNISSFKTLDFNSTWKMTEIGPVPKKLNIITRSITMSCSNVFDYESGLCEILDTDDIIDINNIEININFLRQQLQHLLFYKWNDIGSTNTSRSIYDSTQNSLWITYSMRTNEEYSGGDGTKENPYQISTVQDILDFLSFKIDDYDNSYFGAMPYMYYILTTDLEVNDVSDYDILNPEPYEDYTPIRKIFYGEFDGMNHRISGLNPQMFEFPTIEEIDEDPDILPHTSMGEFIGLSSFIIHFSGKLKNLIIDKVYIPKTENAFICGGIVCFAYAGNNPDITEITNCKFMGVIDHCYMNGLCGGIIAVTADSLNYSNILVPMFDLKTDAPVSLRPCMQISYFDSSFVYETMFMNLNTQRIVINNCDTIGSIRMSEIIDPTEFYSSELLQYIQQKLSTCIENSLKSWFLLKLVSGIGNYSYEQGLPLYIQKCVNNMNIDGFICSGLCTYMNLHKNIPVFVENSYNTGTITVTTLMDEMTSESASLFTASGLITTFNNSYINIKNCYNYGEVSAYNVAGIHTPTSLLINQAFESYGLNIMPDVFFIEYHITNCYNYNNITPMYDSEHTYGIEPPIDYSQEEYPNGFNIRPVSCYSLENTTTNDDNTDVTYLSSDEFKVKSNFTDWDFNNTWVSPTSKNRPLLNENLEGDNLYRLKLSVNNKGFGTATGEGAYEENTIVELLAVPFTSYKFEAWSDGNKKNPRNYVVDHNEYIQAIFRFDGYSIRLLDYEGLKRFRDNMKNYIREENDKKVDIIMAGDSDTPVYFNSAGIPTPCTSLDLNTSGNAGSATKLETSRNISGVPFDGTTDITITPLNIGLGNVNNTSDLDKPISNATQNALMLLESDIDKVSYDNITYRMIDDIFNS